MGQFTATDEDLAGMGFSWKKAFRKTVKVVSAPVTVPTRIVSHAVAQTGRAIVTKRPLRIAAAIATGGLSTLATKKGRREALHPTAIIHNTANVGRAIVTKRPLRIAAAVATGGLSTLATKQGRREAVHVVEDVGHVVAEGARVAERVARRLIMALAQKLLFKKSAMHGDAPSAAASAPLFSRTQAKAMLIPTATAAVASQVPAAAPAVPILVNSVIDELYKRVEAKIAKGLSPQAAQDSVSKEVSTETSGTGVSPVLLWGAGLAAAAGLFFAFKPKGKK